MKSKGAGTNTTVRVDKERKKSKYFQKTGAEIACLRRGRPGYSPPVARSDRAGCHGLPASGGCLRRFPKPGVFARHDRFA